MSLPRTFLAQDIGVGHKYGVTRHGCHSAEYAGKSTLACVEIAEYPWEVLSTSCT